MLLVWLLGRAATSLGQAVPARPAPALAAARTATPITLDGVLDEAAWQGADVATNFTQNFPYDSARARSPTEVRVLYDEQFVYIGAVCHDTLPGDVVVSSLRRDFSSVSDLFEVYVDPFEDRTNGFAFGVNPLGVEREGLIARGTELSLDWDNRWFSRVTRQPGRWTVEMAIPFKTLRYRAGATAWRMNFARVDNKRNQKSTWAPVPRNFPLHSLAFGGEVRWAGPLPRRGTPVSLIPYLTGGARRDQESNGPLNFPRNAGADAKVALTSALNLDLTVNPDFSQVEVDQQVTNLSRFEIFFPERRQFFLENSDLFGRYGFENINPFFSRRIGATEDPSTGTFRQTPIYAGARLSGRLNDKWRVGLLSMQAARDGALRLPSTNYAVAAVQRQVFSRSNVGLLVVSKQAVQDSSGEVGLRGRPYNRVVGLDYNLASADNRWTGKFFYHRSFTSGKGGTDEHAAAAYLNYDTPTFYLEIGQEYVGRDYRAEVGYVPRTNYWRLEPGTGYYFYPRRNRVVNSHGPYVGTDLITTRTLSRTLDHDIDLGYIIRFQNTSQFRFFLRYDYTFLFDAFDPTNTGGPELPTGTAYTYRSLRVRYESDARRRLNGTAFLRVGEYFNGRITALSGRLTYRVQPYGSVSLEYALNRLVLPAPYASATLVLLGPRLDVSFSRQLFLSATAQYNSQRRNLNTNLRLQWRFRPVSDLFIVYTDNYSDRLLVKNRGVVVKLTYWLNL
ncbi:DUF5916 domain-containing protein [Hymenobacter lapidarius]|uniref:DUF5916 domain-containing protein n=1 Tax=Hymenobacter lapidarius TaxID=1908237 RepID=UPI0013013884|nr:DUF5916 domain-containing protein [Hymenobacter lapidarius]